MLRFILVRALVAAAVTVALTLGAAAASAAPPPRPGPPARCTETVRVRPSDGALVTSWRCEVPSTPRAAPR